MDPIRRKIGSHPPYQPKAKGSKERLNVGKGMAELGAESNEVSAKNPYVAASEITPASLKFLWL